MKHLFVTASIAYAAKIGGGTIASAAEINLLDAGAIAVFQPDGTLITTADDTAALAAINQVYLAVGSGVTATATAGGAKVSMMVNRNVTQNTKSAYVAAVKQRSFIGKNGSTGSFNLPGTLVPGTSIECVVVNTTSPVNNTIEAKKFRYQYVIKQGDTATSIITSLIANINADTTRIVNATVVGSQLGIQLDAIDIDVTFAVGTSEVLANATIWNPGMTNALAFTPGVGTALQVRKLEFELEPHEGKTNQLWSPALYWSVPTAVSPTGTYIMYDLKWNVVFNNAINTSPATTQHMVLAVPNGGTEVADLDTILGVVFGTQQVVI